MGIANLIKSFFVSESPQVLGLTSSDEFGLVLANLLFKIDGEENEHETRALKTLACNASEEIKQRMESVLDAPRKFQALEQWFRALALSEAERTQLAEKLNLWAAIDKRRAPEEDAFVIQIAQILEGNERIPLFVSISEAPRVLVAHDLFEYINEERFRGQFPESQFDFQEGRIYTRHPYLSNSLLPFDIEEFNAAQNEIYDGIIDVMKDLGAKRLIISRSQEEAQKALHSAQAGVGVKDIGEVKVGGSVSTEDFVHSKETIKVTFEGTTRPFLTRLFPGRWRRGLISKYRNNPHYAAIIQNRFGHNRIKKLEYQFSSKEARKLAAGMRAALKVKVKIKSVGGDLQYDYKSSTVEAVEKYFFVEFS